MTSIGIKRINNRKSEVTVYENNEAVGGVRLRKKKSYKGLKRTLRVLGRLTYGAYLLVNSAFILWLFISWINVISNNISPDGQIASWNAFLIFFGNAPM